MNTTAWFLALTVTMASMVFTGGLSSAVDTDERIESAAKQSYLFKTYLKDDNISIQSSDCIVTLSGTVSEDFHKTLAQDIVENLPGVTLVENRLEQKGEAPAFNSDAWLISKVKTTLLFHHTLTTSKTDVFAKDGNITIRGEADSTAQRELITEYAKDVEGVKSVNNEMTLPTSAKQTGKKSMGQKVDAMNEMIDDASIVALVKATLLYHRSTSALHTKVKVKDGVVSLEGQAKNEAEKELATKLVSDVHGVKMVVNTMTVK